ncbi:MAG: hypothetical protein ACLRMZ_11035 [Blautia marasmi]
MVLENDMIEQWSSVYKESDSLSSALTKVLNDHQMDMQGFMGCGKFRRNIWKRFYDMVEVLQYIHFWNFSGSGKCVIQIRKGNKSFWVRDSRSPDQNGFRTDLLMERGSKVMSQNMSISLDTSWHTDFTSRAMGKDADDFTSHI